MSICVSLLSGFQPSLSARGFTLDLINCCHKIQKDIYSTILATKKWMLCLLEALHWIIDPNDPQWRWIFWFIPKSGYFGYMIRSVFFTTDSKRVNIASGTHSKQFSYINQLLIFKAILNSKHRLNDRFYPLYLHCSRSRGQNCYTLNRRVLQDFTFPVHIYFKTRLWLARFSKAVS